MNHNAPPLPADIQASRNLATEWRRDCARHYWIGVLQGALMVALAWGLWAFS